MSIASDVDLLLEHPHETVTLDFKESIGWQSRASRLELIRDMACLANRNGGLLIFGVSNDSQVVGLRDGDDPPDPTDLGRFLREYFDPPPQFEAVEHTFDGHPLWIVKVEEFRRIPTIAKRVGNIDGEPARFLPGDVFRRTDAMECARISTGPGMSELVESAVNKTAAVVATMLPDDLLVASTPRVTAVPTDEPLRICDLTPIGIEAPLSTLQLIDLVSDSVVRSRGGILVPRSIDPRSLEPSAVVREPGRIVVERTRGQGSAYVTSLVEVTSKLRVRLREALWEDNGTLDFTSMFTYTLGCLRFAQKLYATTRPTSVTVRVGVAGSKGLRLTDNPRSFTGFFQAYVATSDLDLVATRTLSMEELETRESRLGTARDMNEELSGYFGFRLNDDAYNAHMDHALTNVPELDY